MTVRTVALCAAADVAAVIVFAATGRASHDEAVLAGLWQTAWPFLAALAGGWLITRGWRAPARPLRTGLGLWAVTLVGGMLLRTLSGQGTAVPFILVAAGFLLATLVGWRVIVALLSRGSRRGRRRPRTS